MHLALPCAQLVQAMREIHGNRAQSWTMAQLAKKAVLSRSGIFYRFTRGGGRGADGLPAGGTMAIRKAVAAPKDAAEAAREAWERTMSKETSKQ